MFANGPIVAQQAQDYVVCLPKKTHPRKIEDYRPLTLLSVDYKILARIIANRLKPLLPGIIHRSQHCGTSGSTVFEAVATVRDVTAYAEVMRRPICVVSVDFNSAFDRISHEYMGKILQARGFDNPFLDRIMGLYTNATSEVQINGFRSSLFPIQSSIRQGCPLSMQLFAMCINPLLQTLEEALTGVKAGCGKARIAAVTYADDVTVFLSSPDHVQKLQDALCTYEVATAAKINAPKSRALAVGGWDASREIMNIPYCNKIKILGFYFTDRVNVAKKETWSNITSQVRSAAQAAYYRDLNLDARIRYVHEFLLARIWYVAHIFPLPTDSMRQLNTTIFWFLWRGEIFRVPLSTLHRGRDDG